MLTTYKVTFQGDQPYSFVPFHQPPLEGQVFYVLPEGFDIETDLPVLADGVVTAGTQEEVLAYQAERFAERQEALAYKNLLRSLRIQPFLDRMSLNPKEIMGVDFTMRGLDDGLIDYAKNGRKLSAVHTMPDEPTKIVVRRTFEDINQLDGTFWLKITFEWLTSSGAVGLTKTKIKKNLSQLELGSIRRKRRERGYDYVVEGAHKLGLDDILEELFLVYSQLIDDWKLNGSNLFKAQVIADFSTFESPNFAALRTELPKASPEDPTLYVFHAIMAMLV